MDIETMKASVPGTANLLDELDKKVMVVLRDGRTLIGYLRSVDQFANLVLHQTIERIYVGKSFGDIDRGIFIVRGENVVLLGDIDIARENPSNLRKISFKDILKMQKLEQEAKLEQEKIRQKILKQRGLCYSVDVSQDDMY